MSLCNYGIYDPKKRHYYSLDMRRLYSRAKIKVDRQKKQMEKLSVLRKLPGSPEDFRTYHRLELTERCNDFMKCVNYLETLMQSNTDGLLMHRRAQYLSLQIHAAKVIQDKAEVLASSIGCDMTIPLVKELLHNKRFIEASHILTNKRFLSMCSLTPTSISWFILPVILCDYLAHARIDNDTLKRDVLSTILATVNTLRTLLMCSKSVEEKLVHFAMLAEMIHMINPLDNHQELYNIKCDLCNTVVLFESSVSDAPSIQPIERVLAMIFALIALNNTTAAVSSSKYLTSLCKRITSQLKRCEASQNRPAEETNTICSTLKDKNFNCRCAGYIHESLWCFAAFLQLMPKNEKAATKISEMILQAWDHFSCGKINQIDRVRCTAAALRVIRTFASEQPSILHAYFCSGGADMASNLKALYSFYPNFRVEIQMIQHVLSGNTTEDHFCKGCLRHSVPLTADDVASLGQSSYSASQYLHLSNIIPLPYQLPCRSGFPELSL